MTDRDGRERGRVGAPPEGVIGPSLAPGSISQPVFQRPSTPHLLMAGEVLDIA